MHPEGEINPISMIINGRLKSLSTLDLFPAVKWVLMQQTSPSKGAFGKIKLTELRRDMIQALIARKATEHKKLPIKGGEARQLDTSLSHNSLRIIRAVLGSCLSDAVRDSIILHNPARIVQLPKK